MNRENIIDEEITKWLSERRVECQWIIDKNGVYYLTLLDNETKQKVKYMVGNEDAKYAMSLKHMLVVLEILFTDLKNKNRIVDYENYLTKCANKYYNGNVERAKEDYICKEVKKYYGA